MNIQVKYNDISNNKNLPLYNTFFNNVSFLIFSHVAQSDKSQYETDFEVCNVPLDKLSPFGNK